MSRAIQEVRVECLGCGRRGTVVNEALERLLGEQLTYVNIAELWSKFRCTGCGSKRIRLSDESDRLLLDPVDARHCKICGTAILIPRMEVVPDTNTCSTCAREIRRPEPPPPYPVPPPEVSTCPRCRRPTIVRENSGDGTFFIGCIDFPRCRWTAELPEARCKRLSPNSTYNK